MEFTSKLHLRSWFSALAYSSVYRACSIRKLSINSKWRASLRKLILQIAPGSTSPLLSFSPVDRTSFSERIDHTWRKPGPSQPLLLKTPSGCSGTLSGPPTCTWASVMQELWVSPQWADCGFLLGWFLPVFNLSPPKGLVLDDRDPGLGLNSRAS